MAGRPTDPFRREHEELLSGIESLRMEARRMPYLSPDERKESIKDVVGFLRDNLIPHARAEEEILYPKWSDLVGYEGATDMMSYDHKVIEEYTDSLEMSADDFERLQELLYGIYSLVILHFHKEEDLQFPLFDKMPQEKVDEMVDKIGESVLTEHL